MNIYVSGKIDKCLDITNAKNSKLKTHKLCKQVKPTKKYQPNEA